MRPTSAHDATRFGAQTVAPAADGRVLECGGKQSYADEHGQPYIAGKRSPADQGFVHWPRTPFDLQQSGHEVPRIVHRGRSRRRAAVAAATMVRGAPRNGIPRRTAHNWAKSGKLNVPIHRTLTGRLVVLDDSDQDAQDTHPFTTAYVEALSLPVGLHTDNFHRSPVLEAWGIDLYDAVADDLRPSLAAYPTAPRFGPGAAGTDLTLSSIAPDHLRGAAVDPYGAQQSVGWYPLWVVRAPVGFSQVY